MHSAEALQVSAVQCQIEQSDIARQITRYTIVFVYRSLDHRRPIAPPDTLAEESLAAVR